ncbi:hypothetical protein LWM68_21380 [Niabella sp. W65]|nr:hypothetical protein [Niabella sp. W65]MCH7365083.1 hypothetical protein [Niabella sp. W65]ULT40896.1 hypothetical protein KRR40_40270 [Niabella sp. I65]
MLQKHTKIAIVGGGPGGLTLARLLQLKDARYRYMKETATKMPGCRELP